MVDAMCTVAVVTLPAASTFIASSWLENGLVREPDNWFQSLVESLVGLRFFVTAASMLS